MEAALAVVVSDILSLAMWMLFTLNLQATDILANFSHDFVGDNGSSRRNIYDFGVYDPQARVHVHPDHPSLLCPV